MSKKKELKEKIKLLRSKGYSKYISLAIATIEEMELYLKNAEGWQPEETEAANKTASIEPLAENSSILELEKIGKSQTLKELGTAIAKLSRKGKWKDWELTFWDKNGECRIYLKDVSYTNPKDRGFIKINADGSTVRYWKGNDNFPGLPELPATTNDLEAISLEPHEKAIRNLNREYGVNQWGQEDLRDELEREEYQ